MRKKEKVRTRFVCLGVVFFPMMLEKGIKYFGDIWFFKMRFIFLLIFHQDCKHHKMVFCNYQYLNQCL